jgi:hypothetical protein
MMLPVLEIFNHTVEGEQHLHWVGGAAESEEEKKLRRKVPNNLKDERG